MTSRTDPHTGETRAIDTVLTPPIIENLTAALYQYDRVRIAGLGTSRTEDLLAGSLREIVAAHGHQVPTYEKCRLCNGSGRVAVGPWGVNPPKVECPECDDKRVLPVDHSYQNGTI